MRFLREPVFFWKSNEQMNTYQIQIAAAGYATTTVLISAETKAEAKKHAPAALQQWLVDNDLDNDAVGLAFVRLTPIK